jgi:polyhydroxyalkanoate synthase subunit PhaC
MGRPEAAMSREVRHIGDRGFSVKGTGEDSDRRERGALPTGSALTALYLAQFGWMDVWRRAQGDAGAACGLGPDECPYRIVATGSHWRLRAYSDRPAMAPLLVVAAPIKRPYIWDLAPSVSAVRHCLRQGLDVHLLEWMPATRDNASNGIDEYVSAVSECVAKIAGGTTGAEPFLIGHSLGGTLAAIFAALAPRSIRGLVLLGAPLCFQPQTSRFRDALVSLVPPGLSDVQPFPGSLLSHMSALASPGTFVWSRLMDAAHSIADRHALEILGRVERWALDEVPLPGKLVRQIVDWLYREDRFFRGTLQVGETVVGPSTLSAPTLAVVNAADDVAPLVSVKRFTDAMPAGNARIIACPGEAGVALQHLAILIGRRAHAEVWPQIVSWLGARSSIGATSPRRAAPDSRSEPGAHEMP